MEKFRLSPTAGRAIMRPCNGPRVMSETRTDRAIRIHGLADARAAMTAAADLGVPVLLVSAPGAGCYAGPGWFRALTERLRAEFPQVALTAVLDCADSPGAALAALREGVKDVSLDGPPAVIGRVAAIAEATGCRSHAPVATAFAPEGNADLVRACREWLLGTTEARPPDIANRDVTGY
jgi:hypothetical protein